MNAGLSEARLHNARVHAVADAQNSEIGLDELKITGVCRKCFYTQPDITIAEAKSFNLGYILVSPTGCIHVQSFTDNDTRTACGVEAATTDWWWPL